MSVIEEIAAERQRQIKAEGWTSVHDDTHTGGELPRAAAAYAWHASREFVDRLSYYHIANIPKMWPWSISWWKPKNPRRDLIRAAALLVAEIERLDRAAKEPPA